uniref:C3/C5 convertase n=1 Tax=Cyprinus carpio TaxID=7962 RepID=A0A8C2PPG6_CYPCA
MMVIVLLYGSCPKENINITGGTFVLSNNYSHGSLLRYICPNGYYPSVHSRLCQNEHWTTKTKMKKNPECKKITCPNPRVFENGEVIPYKDKYYVNDTTTYSCNSDYTFRGSAVRVCKPNGKWSGSTPICGRDSDHCPDPGVPPGSSRTGNMFNTDDKVTYSCASPLTLIGSKERVCQDGGQWSGTEPQCYADFTYDTPEEASEAFSSSLKSNLAVEKEEQQGKKITLDQGGKLDIYIAVDASDSVEEKDFDNAKTTIKLLLEKISYYPVSPNYEILMFATDVTPIIKMNQFKMQKPTLTDIFKEMDEFTYDSDKTGTNIAKVYTVIEESMKIEELNNATVFSETQHIIILFSDGTDLSVFTYNLAYMHMYLFLFCAYSRTKGSNCMGSLVTSSYILTAAHCFKEGDTVNLINDVYISFAAVKVKKYVIHPDYNLTAKQEMGIQEYYEFDVALIQLEKPVDFSSTLRPICIPCTKETNGALKLSESEGTCRKHEEILMSNELVEASFTSDMETDHSPKHIKNIIFKLGKYRDACVEDAKKAKGINVENAREAVTDNFLCSGGIEPKTDDVACKGESGGASYVNKKGRVIQVGIISWGVKDICKGSKKFTSDADSRDYHSNLFSESIRSFLKEHLENDRIGNPLTFLPKNETVSAG